MRIQKLNICVFLAALVLLVGCTDMLEVEPENKRSPEEFVSNEQRVLNLLDNAYLLSRRAFTNQMNWLFYGDVRAGHFMVPNGWQKAFPTQDLKFNGYAFSGNYSFDELRNWNRYYDAILQCNYVLQELEQYKGAKIMEKYEKQYRGEILFLRALNYFQILRVWGDAMWIEGFGDTQPKKREAPQVIVEKLAKDLEVAIESLPVIYSSRVSGSQNKLITKIRGSKGGALVLLMNLYALQRDYGQVITCFERIVTNEGNGEDTYFYELQDVNRYEQVFKGDTDESIFFFLYTSDGDYEEETKHLFDPISYNSKKYRLAEADRKEKLLNLYENDGTHFTDGRVEEFFSIKIDKPTEFLKKNDRRMIFRWADVITLASEAYYKTGNREKALKYLNEIRERATISPVSNSISDVDLWAVIMLERERELYGEGWFFFDMVRWGRLDEIPGFSKAEGEAGKIYWPLSRKCFDGNPLLEQTSFWK